MSRYRPITFAAAAAGAAVLAGQIHAQPAGDSSTRVVVPGLTATESGIVGLELVAATSEVAGVSFVRVDARRTPSGDIAFEAELLNGGPTNTLILEISVTFYGAGGEERAGASVRSDPAHIDPYSVTYVGFLFPTPPAGITAYSVSIDIEQT